MPGLNSTLPADSIGMTMLARAAADDDALIEDCCAFCHSANVEPGDDSKCRNCGVSGYDLQYASHLADALACVADPLRKIEHHDLAAMAAHAAMLHMQVAELRETLAAERAAIHELSERITIIRPDLVPLRKAIASELAMRRAS